MRSERLTHGSAGAATALAAALLVVGSAWGAGPQESGPQERSRARSAGNQVIVGTFGGGIPGSSFLGVHVREIDAERAVEKGLPEERGVEITKVVSDSAADEAGLEVGDVVLEYNGETVDSTTEFARLVRETPVGRSVSMKVVRNGAPRTVDATIGQKKKWVAYKRGEGDFNFDIEMPEVVMPDVPHISTTWRSGRLGIIGESLDSQLAEYFGVEEGVLVRSVGGDTPAERAGLKAGDVITKVGNDSVATPREVSSAIREREAGALALIVMRNRKEMNISVNLESPSRGGQLPQRPQKIMFTGLPSNL